jgi:hypothetical protein
MVKIYSYCKLMLSGIVVYGSAKSQNMTTVASTISMVADSIPRNQAIKS